MNHLSILVAGVGTFQMQVPQAVCVYEINLAFYHALYFSLGK